ncbi:hypothetical protein E5N77_00805 [Streptomyces sp. SS52]|nr:hypothetical protein E5N77_00805 [Streptomyces sp. SS52]RSS10571.1 hypothetical protein EF915_27885 [Streptomyces sp. WAC08401]RSS62933.1 hypothetical protein EF907_28215 [Streptomyces sp. WAC06273]
MAARAGCPRAARSPCRRPRRSARAGCSEATARSSPHGRGRWTRGRGARCGRTWECLPFMRAGRRGTTIGREDQRRVVEKTVLCPPPASRRPAVPGRGDRSVVRAHWPMCPVRR